MGVPGVHFVTVMNGKSHVLVAEEIAEIIGEKAERIRMNSYEDYEDFVEILYHSPKLGLICPVTVTKDIIMKNLSAGTIQDLVNEIIEKIVKSMRLYEQTHR